MMKMHIKHDHIMTGDDQKATTHLQLVDDQRSHLRAVNLHKTKPCA
jgi:hypothetical protein